MPLSERRKLLASENHTGKTVEDCRNPLRADMEDDLVYAISESIRSGRIQPFYDYLRKWRADTGLPETDYLAFLNHESIAWVGVHSLATELARLSEFWEHSANWLKDRGHQWGQGQLYLSR